MTSIKSALLIVTVAFACTLAAVPKSSGQTANLSFDDQDGPATSGSYPAGFTFNLAINLSFSPGGNVANVVGVSYYFEQQNPNPPFNFAITNRNVTGSQFTFLQTPGLTYPQSLVPANVNDLGASTQSGTGLGAGNYFMANVKIAIAPSATPGTYVIENTTTAPGKRSVISDDQGHTFALPQTNYTITVVPFEIVSISPGDNQDIVLDCKGVPDHVNRIEASPDLSPNSFQTIASRTADSAGAFSFSDPNPGTQRFYRIAFP